MASIKEIRRKFNYVRKRLETLKKIGRRIKGNSPLEESSKEGFLTKLGRKGRYLIYSLPFLLTPITFKPGNKGISPLIPENSLLKAQTQTSNKPYKIGVDDDGNTVFTDPSTDVTITILPNIIPYSHFEKYYPEYIQNAMKKLYKDIGGAIINYPSIGWGFYTRLLDVKNYKPGVYQGMDQAGVFWGLANLNLDRDSITQKLDKIDYRLSYMIRGPPSFYIPMLDDFGNGDKLMPARMFMYLDFGEGRHRSLLGDIEEGKKEVEYDYTKYPLIKVDQPLEEILGSDLPQMKLYMKAIETGQTQIYEDDSVRVEYKPIALAKDLKNQFSWINDYKEEIESLERYELTIKLFKAFWNKIASLADPSLKNSLKEKLMNGMSFEEYVNKIKPALRYVDGKYTFLDPNVKEEDIRAFLSFMHALLEFSFANYEIQKLFERRIPSNDEYVLEHLDEMKKKYEEFIKKEAPHELRERLMGSALLLEAFTPDLKDLYLLSNDFNYWKEAIADTLEPTYKYKFYSDLKDKVNKELYDDLKTFIQRTDYFVEKTADDIYKLEKDLPTLIQKLPYVKLYDLPGSEYMVGYMYYRFPPIYPTMDVTAINTRHDILEPSYIIFVLDKERGTFIPLMRSRKIEGDAVLIKVKDKETGNYFYSVSIYNNYKAELENGWSYAGWSGNYFDLLNSYIPTKNDFPDDIKTTGIRIESWDKLTKDDLYWGVVAFLDHLDNDGISFGPEFYISNLKTFNYDLMGSTFLYFDLKGNKITNLRAFGVQYSKNKSILTSLKR